MDTGRKLVVSVTIWPNYQCILEKAMATHSNTLAWRIPWTEELGAGYCLWGRKESGTRGNGTPLQYSCLENPMDGRAWKATVHGVAELDTTEQLHFHFSLPCTGEGNGNPLQCSCLENPRDRGACWAAVYRVTHSQTCLKQLSSSSSSSRAHIHTAFAKSPFSHYSYIQT